MAPAKEDTSKGAAGQGTSSTSAPEKAGSKAIPPLAPPAPKAQGAAEPMAARRAPDAPVAVQKDAAMTYTERVTQQAASLLANSLKRSMSKRCMRGG